MLRALAKCVLHSSYSWRGVDGEPLIRCNVSEGKQFALNAWAKQGSLQGKAFNKLQLSFGAAWLYSSGLSFSLSLFHSKKQDFVGTG